MLSVESDQIEISFVIFCQPFLGDWRYLFFRWGENCAGRFVGVLFTVFINLKYRIACI